MVTLIEGLVYGQYIVGLVASLVVTGYVFFRNPKSSAHVSFLLFGALISAWNLTAFLHRTAPDSLSSTLYFLVVTLLIPTFPASLLLTMIWLRRSGLRYLLVFAPAVVIGIAAILWGGVEVVPSSFGWSYRTNPLFFILFLGYQLTFTSGMIGYGLFLRRRTADKVLQRKIDLLWIAYGLVYTVGLSISNGVLLFAPDFPPLGGTMTILMFSMIAYAVSLKPYTWIRNLSDNSFERLLAAVQASRGSGELGIRRFDVKDFLHKSAIESLADGRNPSGEEYVSVLQRTIEYFAKKEMMKEYTFNVMEILTETFERTFNDQQNRKQLEEIVLEHSQELLQTDVAYGAAGGYFLRLLHEDHSLDKLPHLEVSLRIAQRLLLVILGHFKPESRQTIWITVYQHGIWPSERQSADSISDLFVSFRNGLKRLEIEEQGPYVRQKMTALIASLISKLPEQATKGPNNVLTAVRNAINLNRKLAVSTGILQALIDQLNLRVPDDVARKITYVDPYTEDQLDIFSKSFTLRHRDLEGKVIVYEHTSTDTIEDTINKFILECLANGKLCSAYAPRSGAMHKVAEELGAQTVILSPSPSRTIPTTPEGAPIELPLNDLTTILNNMQTEIRNSPPVCIVLDSLTDLILAADFRSVYAFVRYLVDILPSTKAVALLLVNREAHEPSVLEPLRAIAHLRFTSAEQEKSSARRVVERGKNATAWR